MRQIGRDASTEKIIEAINDLIASSNAYAEVLENLALNYRFMDLNQKIAVLEKKLIAQGDLIVSLVDRLNKIDNSLKQ